MRTRWGLGLGRWRVGWPSTVLLGERTGSKASSHCNLAAPNSSGGLMGRSSPNPTPPPTSRWPHTSPSALLARGSTCDTYLPGLTHTLWGIWFLIFKKHVYIYKKKKDISETEGEETMLKSGMVGEGADDGERPGSRGERVRRQGKGTGTHSACLVHVHTQ